jgi:hypothetical protein
MHIGLFARAVATALCLSLATIAAHATPMAALAPLTGSTPLVLSNTPAKTAIRVDHGFANAVRHAERACLTLALYHEHAVSPGWARKLKSIGIIGNHRFYRSERVIARM